ncbi:prepilin-type N-terminal cleavage/methylation domain-containing protein [Candidatus Saccharibacteria bacterium]|nr:prepilin-type N-terminal cleavage/methylation domain-containing protein [Candidatus Saccharibacteria bacterium]
MMGGRYKKQMTKRLDQRGLTIVEVMIVLAVISLVFTITFRVFEPFFNQESFRQSANLFATDLNDVLNDVRTGVFPDYEGVGCQEDGGDVKLVVDPTIDALKPGNNNECILLGKAVQLGTDGTVSELDDKYEVHTLIGLSELNEKSFEQVELFNSPPGSPCPPNCEYTSSRDKIIPQGGEIKMAYLDADNNGRYTDSPVPEIFVDGFAVVIASFGEIQDADSLDFLGGSRNIALRAVYLDAGDDNQNRGRLNRSGFTSNTENHDTTPFYREIEHPIIICLDSGTGEQALIRVGNQNGSLQALVDLDPVAGKAACEL